MPIANELSNAITFFSVDLMIETIFSFIGPTQIYNMTLQVYYLILITRKYIFACQPRQQIAESLKFHIILENVSITNKMS